MQVGGVTRFVCCQSSGVSLVSGGGRRIVCARWQSGMEAVRCWLRRDLGGDVV